MTNPAARPLSDFFSTIETDKAKEPAPRLWTVDAYEVAGVKVKGYRVRVGPYCAIHDHAATPNVYKPSLWVTASDEVMEAINNRMLALEDDVISFDLIRPAGNSDYTLYAKYNLILGSRIIGTVAADSIPNGA